jgi:hypothetical protein
MPTVAGFLLVPRLCLAFSYALHTRLPDTPQHFEAFKDGCFAGIFVRFYDKEERMGVMKGMGEDLASLFRG